MSDTKGKIYKPPLAEAILELTQRITVAVALVTLEMLQKVNDNMTRGLNMTFEVDGRHFEDIKL